VWRDPLGKLRKTNWRGDTIRFWFCSHLSRNPKGRKAKRLDIRHFFIGKYDIKRVQSIWLYSFYVWNGSSFFSDTWYTFLHVLIYSIPTLYSPNFKSFSRSC